MIPKAYRFFKTIYGDNSSRKNRKRTLNKDIIQYARNLLRLPEEKNLIQKYYTEDLPIIYIIGVPRSGTTLLSQLLIYHFKPAYISNQIVKFWISPVSRFNEILQKPDSEEFKEFDSDLGNTAGLKSPHEFGWFWQYWLEHKNTDELKESDKVNIDWIGLKKEIGALAGLNNKALLFKNLVYNNFIIGDLKKLFPKSYFINVERNPIEAIHSIYQARIKTYEDPNVWWSIKPKMYKEWLSFEPLEQIAHQYFYTLNQIDQQLKGLGQNSYITIHYSDLIADTSAQLHRIEEKFTLNFSGISKNEFSKRSKISAEKENDIKKAIDKVYPFYISEERLNKLLR